mgnify:CR=1
MARSESNLCLAGNDVSNIFAKDDHPHEKQLIKQRPRNLRKSSQGLVII